MTEQAEPVKKEDFIYRIWQRLNLFWALTLVVAAASVIVVIGYALYWNNPNRKYDLARPGEKDNQSLRVEDDEADTTSAVTLEATEQKIEYLDKELKALSEVSKFDPEDLSDRSVQLTPSDQPSL